MIHVLNPRETKCNNDKVSQKLPIYPNNSLQPIITGSNENSQSKCNTGSNLHFRSYSNGSISSNFTFPTGSSNKVITDESKLAINKIL